MFQILCHQKNQIKTAIRYHYTPTGMAKSRALTSPNAGEDVGQQDVSFIAGGRAQWCSHLGKQFGGFLHPEACSRHVIQQLVFTQRRLNLISTQNLYVNVYSCFIHDCQN